MDNEKNCVCERRNMFKVVKMLYYLTKQSKVILFTKFRVYTIA